MSTQTDDQMLDLVQVRYAGLAVDPRTSSFSAGRALAENLGYPPDLLEGLPDIAVEAFYGVSSVPLWAGLAPGMKVLDLGCGAGLDSLIAASRGALVTGVDFCPEMLERAARGLLESGLGGVRFLLGKAQELPLAEAEFDAALVNGIFNLNPDREGIFTELARVLRPGGTAYAAELILREPLPDPEAVGIDNWFT